jgi:Na+/H+-translocating membrane pyrophosphatase
VLIGIVLAGVILWLTGHFTGTDKRPTNDVARTSLTGPATVVLSGIGVGLESAVYTAGIIGACGLRRASCSVAARRRWRCSSSPSPAVAC